ncbi:MAG: YkvA family protein [Candidatus Kapaibacteriales bacterium]
MEAGYKENTKLQEYKVNKYEKNYNDKSFLNKAWDVAQRVGREVVEKGFMLYYSAKDQDTPKWARTVVYGALGYFISPIDTVPDFLPGIGFGDDMIVIAAAMAVITVYIKPIHKQMAKDRADSMFGVEDYSDPIPQS